MSKNSEHFVFATAMFFSRSSFAPAGDTYCKDIQNKSLRADSKNNFSCPPSQLTQRLNASSHVMESIAHQGHKAFADTVQLAFP